MPTFGNILEGIQSLPPYISSHLFGHFDSDYMASWGMPIPSCTINKIWLYAKGSLAAESDAIMRFGIYDVSGGVPSGYTLVATSPAFVVPQGITASTWWSVDCEIVLPAGTYALSVLCTNGVNGARIPFSVKDSGPKSKTSVGGTFPNPLGSLAANGPENWSMYAEYTELHPETETAAITSDARIVNPKIFTFARPAAVISKSFDTDVTGFDIKLKHVCNHKLSDGQYTLSKCPRCLGTGYYYDIKFNEMGKLVEISLEDKLQQALEKLVLTDENKFHEDVAIGLKKWLGEVPISKIKAIIKYDLIDGITALKDSQKSVAGLSPRTQIESIDSIVITNLDIDSLHYIVTITTISGETVNLRGVVSFSD